MRFLRQNTATRVTVGPFYDKTDGVTPETALTVTNDKITMVVDDAGVPTLVIDAAPTASGGDNDMVHVTNDDAGFYDLEVTAAQTNYVGRAMLAITDAANHCPVFHEFTILPANVYDAMLGTDKLDVNAAEISGDSTAADNLESACDNYSATRGLAGTALPAAAADAAGGLPISDAGGLDLDTKLAATNEVTAARMGALTDLINGGRLDLLIDAILARLIALALTTGAVATDGSNSATSFKTDLSSSVDNFWNDALLLITSGALAGQVKKITDYDGTSKFVTVETGFTSTPADAVTFAIINR